MKLTHIEVVTRAVTVELPNEFDGMSVSDIQNDEKACEAAWSAIETALYSTGWMEVDVRKVEWETE